MSVYKRGNLWWYDFIFEGVRFQGSTKQGSRRVAEQIEAAKRTQLAKGEVGIRERKPVPTFAEFEKRFRAEMKSTHSAKPRTVTYYTNSLDRLLEFAPLRNARLDLIEEALIAEYIAKRRTMTGRTGKPPAVASLNRELEVLRRALRVAVNWKVLLSAPTVARLRGERQRDRNLTHEEEQSYLAAACPVLR